MNRKARRAGKKTAPPDPYPQAVRLHQAGRLAEAEALYRAKLAADPGHAPSLHRLGVLAHQAGRSDIARDLIGRAIAREPGNAQYRTHLALALAALGRGEDALSTLAAALALAPSADAHNNLGALLMQAGRAAEAAGHFRAAAALAPGLAEISANLGDALWLLGDAAGAAGAYARAGAWPRAALAWLAVGRHREALEAALRALQAGETGEARRVFVQCARAIDGAPEALAPLVARALAEGWDRPEELAPLAARLILAAPDWMEGPLLPALLVAAPNQDWALEQRLTALRRDFLRDAETGTVDLRAALARQCFLNEYVFALDDGERDAADALAARVIEALATGTEITPSDAATLACYRPLPPGLAARAWPPAIAALVTQQIDKPAREAALRDRIPRLTPVDDAVSRAVRAQYEENPYPRWTVAGTAEPMAFADWRRRFPGGSGGADILVAGCGTGRNAIETARRFPDARLLAVDLSLASLAYAERMRGALPIRFAQADILAMGALAERYDLIEAMGVLHHMADPFAGWRVLKGLLKPGGIMKIGLYSAVARRDLPRLDPSQAAADALRTARAGLVCAHPMLTERPDFYTLSMARDLLFHVQEHRLTLGEIADFLAGESLALLGFDLDDSVLAAYRARFPGDAAASDLANWQAFEADNPATFAGMYQFWAG